MNVRFLGSVFAAAALAAALSDCSGGGGAPTVNGARTPPPLELDRVVGMSRPATAAIAARSEPRAGSVTQSSNTASGSDTTADRVEVEFAAGTYTIRNTRQGATWEVGTANAADLPGDVAAGADAVGLVAPEEGGYRFVVAQTRSPTDGNTDWLTAGIWAFVPTDGNALTRYEFGAFADGGDLFEQDDLQALTGTARYGGRAFGVYYSISSDGESDAGPFGGAISLTAEFGTGGELGTVSGRVTDIVIERGESVPGAELALGDADIGSANGGFFTGATSMTLGGRAYEGRWGGQFYDDGDDGAPPGSVAGTFGASITEGDQAGALVGAYAADRQTQ